MTERLVKFALSCFAPKKICRMCLATNVNMFDMKDNLVTQYEQITGLKIEDASQFPKMLCWECAHRLDSCHKFMARAVLAHCLMEDLLKADGFITEANISKIKRTELGLHTRLVENSALCVSINGDSSESIDEDLHNEEDEITVDIAPTEVDCLADEIKMEITSIEKDDFLVDDLKVEEVIDLDEDPRSIRAEQLPIEDVKHAQVLCENNEKDYFLVDDLKVEEVIDLDEDPRSIRAEQLPIEDVKHAQVLCENNITDLSCHNSEDDKNIECDSDIDLHENNSESRDWILNNIILYVNRGSDVKAGNVKKKRKVYMELEEIKGMSIKKFTFEEQMQEINMRKDSSNYKTSQFKCEFCFRGFRDQETFKTHSLKHSERNGPYECEICKLRYRSSKDLKQHKANLHTYKYSCEQCPFHCLARHMAQAHVKFHEGVTYKCRHCEMVFRHWTTYQSHVRIKHPSRFACKLCGRSFIGQKGLEQHGRLKHRFDDTPASPSEAHRCAECELSFATSDALATHLGENHNIRKPRAPRKQELRRRTARAGGQEGNIQCEQCDMKLSDGIAYHAHFRRAHPGENRTQYHYKHSKKTAMCEVCGQICPLAMLPYHMDSHADVPRHTCSVCHVSFKKFQSLRRHIRKTHSAQPDERFPCTRCDQTFTLKTNLHRHVLIRHLGQTATYPCPACDRRFVYRYQVAPHYRHVHLRAPWPKRVRQRRQRPAAAKIPSMEQEVEVTTTEE